MPSQSQIMVNIVSDFFSVAFWAIAFLAFLLGVYNAAGAMGNVLDAVNGRADAPTGRQIGMKFALSSMMMSFLIFAYAIHSTVGQGDDETVYAIVSFTGMDANVQTQMNATLKACLMLLQILGVTGEWKGLQVCYAIVERLPGADIKRAFGLFFFGGVLVHLSFFIKLWNSITQLGVFS